MIYEFHTTPPFDFALSVGAAGHYSVLGRALTTDDQPTYRRVLRVAGALALVEISATGGVEDAVLHGRLLAANGAVDEACLGERLRWMLHPDHDLRPFYAYAAHDPVLAQTAQRWYGLRLFRMDSLFEALIITMIEQQITLKSAQAGERWLIETYGEPFDYKGERYYAFPTPERLAALAVSDLTTLKITFQRMARMIAIAQAQVNGSLDLFALEHAPLDEVYTALRALKGVGHWTACWALIRIGYLLPFGSADVALRAAVNAYHFGQPGRCARADLDALYAGYGAHAGPAAVFTLLRWVER